MTDRRRTFIDSTTNEILLMEWSTADDGWIPALQALNDWQTGKLRVYSPPVPTGWPSMITMPGSAEWPYLLPHEEADVRSILSKPWIPEAQITVLPEEEIGLMESYQEASRRGEELMADADTIAYLDSIVRPALLIELVPELMPAASAAPRAAVPREAVRPAARPQRRTPFPIHLVAAVLAHAAATAALCPITMEPVTPDTATVTSCGHIFQSGAIVQWLTGHDTCPECRAPCCI